MGYMESYKAWCANEYFDEATRAELKSIEGNEKEIEDRFYKDLEFGTGGLRGVIGNGTNRMNIYTVRKATQGLANFIKKENAADRGVAIAYDSRRMSPEFADEAALCLNANGIKAYIFPSLRPTPELSFAVRQLHCIAGIVITASHNPPEYNGYKVYWEDGAAGKTLHVTNGSNSTKKRGSIKKMTLTAMLAAIAVILMYMEIPVPFMPGFIKLDISDLPALFGSFIYGPACGVLICLVKNVLHSFATNTMFVGEISNFILGCAFVVPAGVIYQKRSDKTGAVIASITGTVAMALLSIVSNYFFVYPIYYNFMPKDMILKAYQAIFPGVHSILQALIVFNVPFTLIKGAICVVLAWLLYVPLAPMMRIKD